MIVVAFLCPTCLVEADEPFCSLCGLDLNPKEIDRAAESPVEGIAQRPEGGQLT